jgi:hypothetical protein
MAMALSVAMFAACNQAPPEASPVAASSDTQTSTAIVLHDASVATDAMSPIDAATGAATARDASSPAVKPAKHLGARCEHSAECTVGLSCCATSFTGTCGGANMPDRPQPCVILHSCQNSPCASFSLPP